MNIKERIVSLKLNVKQHRDQIKILLKEIKDLEHYKNSNENLTIDISNDVINNFCISNDNDIILSKNENLNKFI